MAVPRLACLAALLLLAALPAPAPAQGAPAGVALVDLAAGYGSEAWKDEPPEAGALLGGAATGLPVPPPGPVAVYANPYWNATTLHQGTAAWLGYNLTATLELRDAAGRPDANGTDYVLARLEGSAGSVPAKMARLGGARFLAQLDLDGDDAAGLAAPGEGEARLVAERWRASRDPLLADERVGVQEFPVRLAAARLDLGDLAVPEGMLPGYAEVGAGPRAALVSQPLRPGESLVVRASLGVPDAPAVAVAWHGDVRTLLGQGRTDAAGAYAVTVDAGRLTGGNASGLAVVGVHLAGADGTLGGAAAAVPVSAHPVRVVAYDHQHRSAAGQDLGPADVLVVRVEDRTAGDEAPARGDLALLGADGAVLAEVPFSPASFAPGATVREALLPTALLDLEGRGAYQVLAFLLQADGRLYALATATRGLALGGGEAAATPGERGALSLVVRNLNGNGDGERDPGLALPVRLVVQGLPGSEGFEADLLVEEGAEQEVQVPFRGEAGVYPVVVNATAGELRQDLAGTVRVAAPDRGFLGLPGPGPWLLALAGVAAAAALQRASTRR